MLRAPKRLAALFRIDSRHVRMASSPEIWATPEMVSTKSPLIPINACRIANLPPFDGVIPVQRDSYAEVHADHLFGQFADRSGSHATAFVEYAEFAGNSSRKGQFLLHQQHRQAFFLIEP